MENKKEPTYQEVLNKIYDTNKVLEEVESELNKFTEDEDFSASVVINAKRNNQVYSLLMEFMKETDYFTRKAILNDVSNILTYPGVYVRNKTKTRS